MCRGKEISLFVRIDCAPMQPYRFYHISSFSTTCSLLLKKKMPPKKAVVEKKTLLGRPSNNLKIGIVGLFWSLGHFLNTHTILVRSSKCRKIIFFQRSIGDRYPFFQFLAKKNLTCCIQDLGKAANFPYATINPEEARIPVPDTRFEWLCDVYKPASRVPAFLTCIDIAGLTAVRLPSSFRVTNPFILS